MDLSRRRGRGRARGSSSQDGNLQQQQSPTNPQRPQITRNQPQPVTRPQIIRPSMPQQPGPPSMNVPRGQTPIRPPASSKQVPRNQNVDSSQVEQVSEAISNLSTTESSSTPLGRGAIRGRTYIEQDVKIPRPESSLNSKQGTSGQHTQLLTNYFPIKSCPNWTLYQYRVDFNPIDDRINILRGLLHTHASTLGAYIFDGTMMFSCTKYKSDTFELVSKRNVDDQIVIITVTFVSVVKAGDYSYIQVYNLLLRNCMRHLNLQLIGRNFYDPAAKIDIPKHRLQIWPGYESTIGIFDSGLMLRAEVTTKIMRQDTVLNFFEECYHKDKINYMDLFKAGILGTIVITTYNNNTYKIDDVAENATINSTFKKKDGTSMSYIDYYQQKWNLVAKNTGQPMLISKKKKIFGKLSSEEDLIYLVPEFCTLTGLTDVMRNNFTLMRDLAVYTQVDPLERINRYTNFMNRLQNTPKSLETFSNWNLTLDNTLVRVPCRVLPLEVIYGKIETKKYDGGDQSDWTRHVRSLPMFTCGNLINWSFICCAPLNENLINTFIKSLQNVSKSMNFTVPPPQINMIRENNVAHLLRKLENIICSENPLFILCVLPNPRADIYNGIKRKLCVDRAIPSQVVLAKHLTKNNMSVITKIAIQINCKLGGAPWYINIPIKKDLMIVGFDVCHDKQNKNISYGALVATTNDTYTSYFSCVHPHQSGQELSNNFGTLIIRAMQKYFEKNKKIPKRIIIYRDGVGDGQLSYVYKTEVDQIKTLCKQIYKEVPAMAFIIVKKRISTRFFMPNDKAKTYMNPPPGTVVDSGVTDPTMYDFFLVSQNSRFGTVTPTHYNVIEDTLYEWSPDKMQRLTYKLTHMYYNWSGTIRVPAPCQLAHKLAFFTAQTLQKAASVGLDELLYFL